MVLFVYKNIARSSRSITPIAFTFKTNMKCCSIFLCIVCLLSVFCCCGGEGSFADYEDYNYESEYYDNYYHNKSFIPEPPEETPVNEYSATGDLSNLQISVSGSVIPEIARIFWFVSFLLLCAA